MIQWDCDKNTGLESVLEKVEEKLFSVIDNLDIRPTVNSFKDYFSIRRVINQLREPYLRNTRSAKEIIQDGFAYESRMCGDISLLFNFFYQQETAEETYQVKVKTQTSGHVISQISFDGRYYVVDISKRKRKIYLSEFKFDEDHSFGPWDYNLMLLNGKPVIGTTIKEAGIKDGITESKLYMQGRLKVASTNP